MYVARKIFLYNQVGNTCLVSIITKVLGEVNVFIHLETYLVFLQFGVILDTILTD